MERVTNTEYIESFEKVARDRYDPICNSEIEIFQNVALMQYHTTSDGLIPYAHIVEISKDDIDSDDISALLEGAFHDIKDRCDEKHFEDVVYQIMGAIPENELDETLKEYEEYVTLDCGYVIPGLIDFVRVAEIEDEEVIYVS